MNRGISPAIALFSSVALLGLPSPAAAHGGGEHIKVIARTLTEHYEDVGRKGESPGDFFTFTDRLMKNGERVGRDSGKCDVTRVTKRSITFQCVANLTFKGKGQLTVQGAVTYKRGEQQDPRLAVTGGTGDYAGASGEFVLVERRGEPTRYRIHLTD